MTGARQLAELARADAKWTAIEAICEGPADDLLAAARTQFATAPNRRADLIALLRRLPGGPAEQLLVEWLDDAFSAQHAAVLRALAERRASVPNAILERVLAAATPRPSKAAAKLVEKTRREFEQLLAAVGCLGDTSLAPLVARHLDAHPATAALALGRLGARDHIPALLDRLPRVEAAAQSAIVAAFELLDDASVAPALLAWLRTAPGEVVYDLHHALGLLLGWEPLLPLYPADHERARDNIRAGWAAFEPAEPRPAPRLEQVTPVTPHELRFSVVHGLATARVRYNPPSPFSSWLRWDNSLTIAGRPVYALSSFCDTCEATMQLAGWPPERAAVVAGAVRDALADVTTLSAAWLRAMAPLLHTLCTGHWLAARAEFTLERVTSPEQSWWSRRGSYRTAEDADPQEVWSPWPGTEHFQVCEPLSREPPTFGVIMPTQPLAALDEATIAGHEQAIRAGLRPACLLLAWIDRRTVRGECDEQLLIGVILDGHHKLAAYARCGVPAPAVLLCRLEDTHGPADARERWFVEALRSR